MAILEPRRRQLYFRVSQEEFDRFRRVQLQVGARSLSDLFRKSLERLENEKHNESNTLEQRLVVIGASLAELNFKLEHLTMRLGLLENEGE